LAGQRSKRVQAVGKKPVVRVELPHGLGLSDEDLKELIDCWIVPQLIRAFFLEMVPKRPVQSVTQHDLAMPDDQQVVA